MKKRIGKSETSSIISETMEAFENSLLALKSKLLELSYLKSTFAILDWDEQTYMPQKGSPIRANTKAYLAGLLHEKFTSPEFSKLLKEVKELNDAGKLDDTQQVVFREVYREWEREKKLPSEYVTTLAQTTSEAHHVWATARKNNDFKSFLPYLKKIVELKKQEAKYIGYKESPYDALLDTFEPNLTARDLDEIFQPLKEFLIPFIKQIKNSKVKIGRKIIQGKFPIQKQQELLDLLAQKMGFPLDRSRIDISAHPFTTNFNADDVRITVKYDPKDIMPAVGSLIHEMGHAFYELGIPTENFGTALGESISLGIHESQSRVWENQIGKSRNFWKYFYPSLRKIFPQFKLVSFDDFYKAINMSKPSLIRIESDEVTYNLHIIIRYELERALIEDKIKVEDMPRLWNEKIKEYLGIKVPDDADGVLQDVHWSGGMIGYFPTYSLGNLYSAQFYRAAKKEIKDLEERVAKGDFEKFHKWLNKNIHMHGKYYSAAQLVKKVTGEELNSKYFIEYIRQKYSEIYKLK